MLILRAFSACLGALAVVGGGSLLAINIIFAITVSQTSSLSLRVTAYVASGLSFMAVISAMSSLGEQLRHWEMGLAQLSQRPQHILAALTGLSGIMSGTGSAISLAFFSSRMSDLPDKMIQSSTSALIVAAFVVWAVALVSQTCFAVAIFLVCRRDNRYDLQPYYASPMRGISKEQEEKLSVGDSEENDKGNALPESSIPNSPYTESEISVSPCSPGVHVASPDTSKTKLITNKDLSWQPSIKFTLQEDCSFDSWDTSAVDPQSRDILESTLPVQTRLLETIPASPPPSRPSSPGRPLDLQPSRTRKRSSSYSPSSSLKGRERSRTSMSQAEAHIHPLFRSDSPSKPPDATPGTVVTAAPGGGEVLLDPLSLVSVHRLRSGSFPNRLGQSRSCENVDYVFDEEAVRPEEIRERTLTPPIPDYILTAGSRRSMSGYNLRKKPTTSPGPGRMREARDTSIS